MRACATSSAKCDCILTAACGEKDLLNVAIVLASKLQPSDIGLQTRKEAEFRSSAQLDIRKKEMDIILVVATVCLILSFVIAVAVKRRNDNIRRRRQAPRCGTFLMRRGSTLNTHRQSSQPHRTGHESHRNGHSTN